METDYLFLADLLDTFQNLAGYVQIAALVLAALLIITIFYGIFQLVFRLLRPHGSGRELYTVYEHPDGRYLVIAADGTRQLSPPLLLLAGENIEG